MRISAQYQHTIVQVRMAHVTEAIRQVRDKNPELARLAEVDGGESLE